MQIKNYRHPFLDYMYIILGTTLLALAINMFFAPLGLVTGGVTGLAIIIKTITVDLVKDGFPIYITNLVINIPLFILAIIIKGKNFGTRSLFATFYLSFALFYTQSFEPITYDMLLGSVFGGALAGVGLGLVFSAFSTTGGTDLLASIIQHFLKHHSVARIMFIADGTIITMGLFIFGVEKAMYAIVSIYISVKVIDAILEGIHFSKAAFIISEKNGMISQKIMELLDRGVTGLEGQGKFTNMSKEVLLCVVSKREIVKLKEIVRDIDLRAFVIVADVREVVGEGFIEYETSKITGEK
jgi:uncharacterized membrane-anchored protein YitT (DUF2179 family)